MRLRPGLTQQQGEQDCEGNAGQQWQEGRLVVTELALPALARRRQTRREDRSKNRGRREVEKIDDSRRGAAVFGSVGFLDHRVRNHRRARGDPGKKPEAVRRKRVSGSKEDQCERSKQD